MSLVDNLLTDPINKQNIIINWILKLSKSLENDKELWKLEYEEIIKRTTSGCNKIKLFSIFYYNGNYEYYNLIKRRNNIEFLQIPSNINCNDFDNEYFFDIISEKSFLKNSSLKFNVLKCKKRTSQIEIMLNINELSDCCKKCLSKKCIHKKKKCIII